MTFPPHRAAFRRVEIHLGPDRSFAIESEGHGRDVREGTVIHGNAKGAVMLPGVSLDLNAAFGLGDTYRGIDWLRDELAREPVALREAVARYRDRWTVQAWTVAPPAHGAGQILGPGGFALAISSRAVLLYHLLPFRCFTGVEPERELLRGACRAIASIVGSAHVIYMHELVAEGFYDGNDLDGIEASLRASLGSPSPTFAALHAAESFGEGCWFIDTFVDVR